MLVGSDTYARPWVRYEILKSFVRGNHLFAVHINGVKGKDQKTKYLGPNPLEYVAVISDAVLSNAHMQPQVQQLLGLLLLHLATNSEEKMATLDEGATKLGYVLMPGDQHQLNAMAQQAPSQGGVGMVEIRDVDAPFRFRFVAA